MIGRVSVARLDELIQEFVSYELRFRQVTRERAQTDLDNRLAKIEAVTGTSKLTESDIFNLQLRAENLEMEYQRLMRTNADWSFYASVLYGAKLLMAGDRMAKHPPIANAIRACLDTVLDAVADPNNIKRIRDIDENHLSRIVEVGNMFRSHVTKAVFDTDQKQGG